MDNNYYNLCLRHLKIAEECLNNCIYTMSHEDFIYFLTVKLDNIEELE